MTLGEKIRKYRFMKNLTQKELGIKAGFSPATADSRIRKYEKDVMAPKTNIREKIADALDVDMSALSDIDIRTYEDVMQVLFLFEENFDMDIERSNGKTYLVFDESNKDIETLISYLYMWHSKKKSLPTPKSGEDITYEDTLKYKEWKARFPKDTNTYWKKQQNELDAFYKPLMEKSSKFPKETVMLSEFILQIRKLIQAGVTIETKVKTFGVGDVSLILAFYIHEILNTDSKTLTNCFTEFLCTLETLQNYGMPITRNILTKDKGTQVSYCLRLSPLAGFKTMIDQIQSFEKNKEHKNDWDIDSFESEFEGNLELYNLDLKEEIKRVYPPEH